RTFNNLIKNTFHQTPTQLRKNQPPAKNNGLTLKLSYRPPYDWAHMLAYLSRRAIPGVESVSSAGYRRTVALGGESGWIEVIPEPEQAALRLQVPSELGPHLSEIVSRTRHLFDLEADPMAINAALADDPRLAAAVGDRPGLRVPGAWDEFELAARAVAGQQITVTGAGQLLGRLAARCGKPLPDAGLDTRAFVFPSAGDIVGAALDGGGLTAARRTALQALAADLHANGPWRERWLDLDQAVGALTGFPGVGPWTAHYIAMRALAFPDAFPAGDLWLRKAFAPEPSQPLSEQALTHMAEDWRPWRAYAAVHIWANL
ncbi:MAG: 3-methyladenine DNA glycosylase 2, partial [Anaerolineae bacterium]|nr:3-methyladenine DNA glycosylase 2 [Anaerolineae bacterium]